MVRIKMVCSDLLVNKDWYAVGDCADSSCTTGYDNDGSTGYEIFQNGVELGMSARDVGCDIYVVEDSVDNIAYFFLAKDVEHLMVIFGKIPDSSPEDDEGEED